ncbi:hypothetical protein Dimus_031436 [Dionaea muscipula]
MGSKMASFTTIIPFKEKPHFLPRKFLSYALFAILSVALFRILCLHLSSPIAESPAEHEQFTQNSPILFTSSIGSFSAIPKVVDGVKFNGSSSCDYSNGKWVPDKSGPLYNGTSCGTIKDGQNCMSHGRPDLGYLFWRWEPRQCRLPRFDPRAFLHLMRNKNLAFVGDSMARNQLESLLCMLGSLSLPTLVYSDGEAEDSKFRRWHFASHNVNVSVYWSPFLVKGFEKTGSGEQKHNKLFMDTVDEKWASDLGLMDMVVLSIGHWYLHPAVYMEGDLVLGCHYCPTLNHTEIEFYGVYGKAFRTALQAIIQRKGSPNGNGVDVLVTTFSPHHFEGEWDKAGACPKTNPYNESEKMLDAMDEQMRKAQVAELEEARRSNSNARGRVRIAAIDVTKLASLRPDGHPGPYMHPFPLSNGVVQDRVQNDCVHWCLPGPIDTWNEIMLDIIKGWHLAQSSSSRGGGE